MRGIMKAFSSIHIALPYPRIKSKSSTLMLRRLRYDEHRKNLTRHNAVLHSEGHQIDVDGVKHQLDRHQHHHAIASRKYAIDTYRKQHSAQNQELV